MPICHITGVLHIPTGGPIGKAQVTFKPVETQITDWQVGAVVPKLVCVHTDIDGNIDVSLIAGLYSVIVGNWMGWASVPDAPTASISDILDNADPVVPIPSWLNDAREARDEAVGAAESADIDADRAEDAANQSEAYRDQARDAVIDAQASSLTVATWAALSSIAGTTIGLGAEVLDSDTGSHTQSGSTVPNAGRYSWSGTEWIRIGGTGLSAKDNTADREALIRQMSLPAQLHITDDAGFTIAGYDPDGKRFGPDVGTDRTSVEVAARWIQDEYGYQVFSTENIPTVRYTDSVFEFERTDPHGYSCQALTLGESFNGGGTPGPTPVAEAYMGKVWWRPAEWVAHGGTWVPGFMAPSNSLDAVVFAARAGFKWCETDVRFTSDGVPVLMHDETINATCRNASDYSVLSSPINVSDLTFSDLRSNYVLAANNPTMRRPVPSLEEWVVECLRYGVKPLPEPKDATTNAKLDAICEVIIGLCGQSGCGVIAFDPTWLDYIRSKYNNILLGYIRTPSTSVISHVASKLPAFLNSDYNLWTPELMREANLAGVDIGAWTIPASDASVFLSEGLKYVTTDLCAPPPDSGCIIQSESDLTKFQTTGYISGGTLNVSDGGSVSFQHENSVDFGAIYIVMEYKGSGSITTPTTAAIPIASNEYGTYSFSMMLSNTNPGFNIIAGSGGLTVKSISAQAVKF